MTIIKWSSTLYTLFAFHQYSMLFQRWQSIKWLKFPSLVRKTYVKYTGEVSNCLCLQTLYRLVFLILLRYSTCKETLMKQITVSSEKVYLYFVLHTLNCACDFSNLPLNINKWTLSTFTQELEPLFQMIFIDADILEENIDGCALSGMQPPVINLLVITFQPMTSPYWYILYSHRIIFLSYKKANFCYLIVEILENFFFKNKHSNDPILLFQEVE